MLNRGPYLSLVGKKVFVVEDEALVLMDLEDLLRDLGCEIVASAASLDEALATAGEVGCDAAILDVNLAGRSIGPVADRLAGRGIPFLFATGYGPASLPASHGACGVVAKPYTASDLRAALSAILSAASAAKPPAAS